MTQWFKTIPWRRVLLIVVTGFASYILVPVTLARYSELRSLREARMARAIKFGDRNEEFNSKINATTTLLRMFGSHNSRNKISGAELAEIRRELVKNYRERYLELDSTVWWWPSDMIRETRALQLLSESEMTQLEADAVEYNKSVLATMNQMTTYWRFLDSPEYRVDDETRKKMDDMETAIAKEFQTQHGIRQNLVKRITTTYAQSHYRTGLLDRLGF